jgi:hypothetical protein
MSALLHREPILRRRPPEASFLSTNRMFSATSACEWASVVQSEATMRETEIQNNDPLEREDSFSAYGILEGLGTSIEEHRRHGGLDDAAFDSYHNALINWYNSYGKFIIEEQPGKLCLMVLWHWVYMSLLVDLDQLECAIGRDGPEAAHVAIEYVSNWILSPNSTRCVLHALLLQRQLQSFSFDSVPAIHVPRALFSAAIAWYCYLQYGPTENAGSSLFENLHAHFPEFGVLSPTAHKQLSHIICLSWKHGKMSAVKAATLCGLGDSLQRITHWGIAGKFARIVSCLIYGGLQEAM